MHASFGLTSKEMLLGLLCTSDCNRSPLIFAGVLLPASGTGSVNVRLSPPPLKPDTFMLLDSCIRSGNSPSSPDADGAGVSGVLLLLPPAAAGSCCWN